MKTLASRLAGHLKKNIKKINTIGFASCCVYTDSGTHTRTRKYTHTRARTHTHIDGRRGCDGGNEERE
jgi:hypothetical protein